MQTLMPRTLDGIAETVAQDPGLIANTSAQDIASGVAAARLMNEVIAEAIAATKVNDDGNLSTADLKTISRHIRSDDDLYGKFVEGHGDDDGNEETGFHLVQGDGGTLQFQGREYVDTIADAVYHVGFKFKDGRFENEDGNANERVDDVAGWMNFFVNGENSVFGSGKSETLHSGDYSDLFADAANETFYAYGGNDKVWTGAGDDTVWAGSGHDEVGGDDGNDTLHGQAGRDKLWGGEGNDMLDGGAGRDVLGGGDGDDTLIGGRGHDKLWAGKGDDVVEGGAGNDVSAGDDGNDTMSGGRGRDTLWGNNGDDMLDGGAGRDKLGGGDGNDVILGGGGRDRIWGNDGDDVIEGGTGRDVMTGCDGADTFIFNEGDSGLRGGSRDVIQGFNSGEDMIDLTSIGVVSFLEDGAFTASGGLEARYDKSELQIDADGDGTTDMAIFMRWADGMAETDFV